MAGPASGADSRVTKFEHRLQEVFNFDRREIAVVCVLLLRGPQTPGELRSRTDRMYHFEALDDIVSTLDRLAQRDPPLARVLPRQPGTKESRYMHLFSGEPPISDATGIANVARAPSPASADADRSNLAGRRSRPPAPGTHRSPAATRRLPQAIRVTAHAAGIVEPFSHPKRTIIQRGKEVSTMFAFLLWCILFVLCWPLALLALIAYPFIWLLLLPFRIVGVAVHGVLEVIFLAITLPFRLLAAPFRV